MGKLQDRGWGGELGVGRRGLRGGRDVEECKVKVRDR